MRSKMINNFEQFNSQTNNNLVKNKPIKNPTFRIYILLVVFIFAFTAIGTQMILMVLNPIPINGSKKVILTNKYSRKEITDRNGILLATNVKVNSLYAHPSEIIDKKKVLNSLKKIFNETDQEIFKKKLYSKKPFVWLRKTISPEQQKLVKDIGQPGLYFGPREMRIYPNGTSAAHILGGTRYGFESVDSAEILNASENTNREIAKRFDFRGVTASALFTNDVVTISAEADFQCQQLFDRCSFLKLLNCNLELGEQLLNLPDLLQYLPSCQLKKFLEP